MSGFIRVPADDAGKRVDTVTLTDELVEVHRQKMVVTGGSGTAEVVVVTDAAPAGTDMGLVVRQAGTLTAVVSGTVNVNGGVAISGTATVAGNVNISTMPAVTLAADQVLGSISRTVQVAIGTPFVLDSISATVGVKGQVSLAAGTSNIGLLDSISRTVQVAIGTPFTLQGISTTVTVAGVVGLTAGTAVIGDLNAISRTVQVAIGTPFILQGISTTVTVAGNVNISATAFVSAVIRTSGGTAVEDAANNALRVNIVAGGGTGGTAQTDGTTFSTQAALFTPIGGIFDDASTDTLSENDAGIVRMTTNRGMHVNLRTDGGTALEDSANSALRVNVVAGSAGGPSLVDNTTFSVSTTGTPASIVPIGALFHDTAPAISAGAGGILRATSARAMHVNLRDSAGTELGGASATGIFVRTATIALAADQILGSISRTVQVAIGTPFTLQGISTTVIVAMSNQTLQGISTTVTVVGVVSLAAGSILDSISATVGVKGQVSLAAGTSNIGIINNISATVTVAGNVNISATPSVILAAGTANFGTLNDISRTVQVAIATPIGINSISATVTTVVRGFTPAVMAASHGPKCVTASTSSNVTLIASPGAGANIYVTQLMVGNFSSTLTRARIGTSASISTIVQPLAASGGGFVLNFDPPWMLTASEACVCSVKPNVADVFFTVNFFVI